MEQGVAFAGWVQAVNAEQCWSSEDVAPIPECNISNLGRHLMQSNVVQDAGVVQVFTAEKKHNYSSLVTKIIYVVLSTLYRSSSRLTHFVAFYIAFFLNESFYFKSAF